MRASEVYGTAHVTRLSFVRRARELGFTLDQVRALLRLVDREDHAYTEARELAAQHLQSVRARIADLRRMEPVLAGVNQCCGDDAMPECPLLETLFDGGGFGSISS